MIRHARFHIAVPPGSEKRRTEVEWPLINTTKSGRSMVNNLPAPFRTWRRRRGLNAGGRLVSDGTRNSGSMARLLEIDDLPRSDRPS